jgi:hypothetical protein
MKDRLHSLSNAPPFMAASIFARTDYWRSQPVTTGRIGHKEWSHFCVLTEQVSMIVNFSLMQDSTLGHVPETPRVAVIMRKSDGTWVGDIDQFPSENARIGRQRTSLAIGKNRMRLEGGLYHVDAQLESEPLKAQLRFRPLARPAVASSVRLSQHERMRWLVVPRLAAVGEVRVEGKSFSLDNAPAYHDRNWGYFRWGTGYAWEWATILPASLSVPWSLVYMRISDASRNVTYSQGLMVWRHDRSERVFHDNDLRINQSGWLKQKRILRLPRIVNLMVAGETTSIPRDMKIEGRAWSDNIDLQLSFENFMQVGVPNDGSAGLTLLSEASGSAAVTGRIAGEAIEFEGRVLAEFNHAG